MTVFVVILVSTVVVVAVMEPAQLSVAVGIVVTFTEHCPLIGGKAVTSGTGAIPSLMMTFCNCVVAFPLPSVYVHVITVLAIILVKIVDVVAVIVPEQLSVAVGMAVTFTEHCAVIFGKVATFGTGAAVSLMMTFCNCVLLFPFPSV